MTQRPTALFLDVGGVLLTNGWDRSMRKRAAETFKLDYDEMDERHHLTFDTYEEGKLSLDEYLNRVVFYKARPFSGEEFKTFMFAQSQPYPQMIAVNRIQKFGLAEFVDFFIASCFVHFRKPDADIYRLALDVAQVSPERVVYIEDRFMFVEVAGEKPASITRTRNRFSIQTGSGKQIACNLLIVGIGVSPETKLAEGAGLKAGNGIIVNEYLQTSDSNIYAAGDIDFKKAVRFYPISNFMLLGEGSDEKDVGCYR